MSRMIIKINDRSIVAIFKDVKEHDEKRTKIKIKLKEFNKNLNISDKNYDLSVTSDIFLGFQKKYENYYEETYHFLNNFIIANKDIIKSMDDIIIISEHENYKENPSKIYFDGLFAGDIYNTELHTSNDISVNHFCNNVFRTLLYANDCNNSVGYTYSGLYNNNGKYIIGDNFYNDLIDKNIVGDYEHNIIEKLKLSNEGTMMPIPDGFMEHIIYHINYILDMSNKIEG